MKHASIDQLLPHLKEEWYKSSVDTAKGPTPGDKYDDGKPRMWACFDDFGDALQMVAGCWTAGADEYSDDGWRRVPNGKERYRNALLRHLFAAREEAFDEDSGYPHMAHVAWNALALLELDMPGILECWDPPEEEECESER